MEKKVTEETVGERMTEETVGENSTEEEGDRSLEITSCILLFFTLFLLGFGWFLPVKFRRENVNVRIPDYIWFGSAAFHVIITAIWTLPAIMAFQVRNTRILAYVCFVFIGLCLTSFVSLFIWFV